jgi:hypothetical protein
VPRDHEEDRRRSPRFSCGGEARIYSLPSDGLHVRGRLRNLSLGGVCLDTSHGFDLGTRTEILVSVNAASFRTLGLVRAVEPSRASIEFVQMSAGGKDMLVDLIAQFERLATAVNKLRSERMGTEEQLRREMEQAEVRVARLGGRDLSPARAIRLDSSGHEPTEQERAVEVAPLLLRVDLFG